MKSWRQVDEKTHDDILEELVEFFDIDNLKPKKLKFKSQNWYWFAYFDGPLKLPKTQEVQ